MIFYSERRCQSFIGHLTRFFVLNEDHEEGFKNEMKKYLNEGTSNVAHLHSVIAQLVKVNVVLKDFSD